MKLLLEKQTSFLKHYENLVSRYTSGKDILVEGMNFIKQKIRTLAASGGSKYSIYLKINPDLEPSPFLHLPGEDFFA